MAWDRPQVRVFAHRREAAADLGYPPTARQWSNGGTGGRPRTTCRALRQAAPRRTGSGVALRPEPVAACDSPENAIHNKTMIAHSGVGRHE